MSWFSQDPQLATAGRCREATPWTTDFDRAALRRQRTAPRRTVMLFGVVALGLVALAGALLVGTVPVPVGGVRAVPTCDGAVRPVQQYPMAASQTRRLQEGLSGMSLLANASSNQIAITGWEGTAGADDCRVTWTYRER